MVPATRARAAAIAITAFLVTLALAVAGDNPPGIAKFHRVYDQIYRGAEPSPAGLRELKTLGIKTVVDLRDGQWEREKTEVTNLGMQYIHIPMNAHILPPPHAVQQALAVLSDNSKLPVFVHCAGGRDRTGMVIACYRIVHDHWTSQKALADARETAGRNLTDAMERFIRVFKPPEQSVESGHPQ
jgi:tyrosine-protein phosphatase SIW14